MSDMTGIKYVYITPIHNDYVETRQTQGWKLVDKHPTNPDYTLMTKTVEE